MTQADLNAYYKCYKDSKQDDKPGCITKKRDNMLPYEYFAVAEAFDDPKLQTDGAPDFAKVAKKTLIAPEVLEELH